LAIELNFIESEEDKERRKLEEEARNDIESEERMRLMCSK